MQYQFVIAVAAYTQDVLFTLCIYIMVVGPRHDLARSIFYSLLPLRVYEWSKIRVTSKFASEMKSKNLPPTSQHFAAHLNKHNNLQQPTHAHCPYHDVLALLPVDQPSMSTTLLLASLRVERHRLQLLLLSLKDCNWKHTENRHHHAAIIRRY